MINVDRPLWQRDALRRLVTNGTLHNHDIAELSQLCKSGHGLAQKLTATPLKPLHIRATGLESKPVVLQSLRHHSGVNALAQDQAIEFGPSLTVVYGANAAGKSGYTRILKRACRARGAEEILGNVVSGTAPGRPSATIAFRVGDQLSNFHWNDDDAPPNPNLSRVSVFDRHCASVYVSQRTDVAFRPLGLDLFDRLSAACEAVKKTLERERSSLESQGYPNLNVAPGTAVHDLIGDLTSLTNPDSVRTLASLSVAEKDRQVIVFTHDIVFLLALRKAEGLGVDLRHQYLRRDRVGSGLSAKQLPWAAMKVKNRIGHLKSLQQAADEIYRTGDTEKYEKDAQYIYGLLREAWERGFEEVLLGGAVERYRNSVETQRARQLADISEGDCRALDAGMTKSSRWLSGHDQAPAENAPVPDPQELEDDIKALEDWIGEIRKRRQKKTKT